MCSIFINMKHIPPGFPSKHKGESFHISRLLQKWVFVGVTINSSFEQVCSVPRGKTKALAQGSSARGGVAAQKVKEEFAIFH